VRAGAQFQSSPDPKAGCYDGPFEMTDYPPGFQSSPDPKAGCYGIAAAAIFEAKCFNPHPTRRPGATKFLTVKPRGLRMFQSSPDPKAGCYT